MIRNVVILQMVLLLFMNCGLSAGRADDIKERENETRMLETKIRKLKVLQLVQKSSWSKKKLSNIEKSLVRDKKYKVALNKLYEISKEVISIKRELDSMKDSSTDAYLELKLALREFEVGQKEEAAAVEESRLENYEEANSFNIYLETQDAFDDFNKGRGRYFKLLIKLKVDGLTEEQAGEYFDFNKLDAHVKKAARKIFTELAMVELKVRADIAAYWWEDYCDEGKEFSLFYKEFRGIVMVDVKKEYGSLLKKYLSSAQQKRMLLILANDEELIKIIRESKQALVKNIIHQKIGELLQETEKEIMKSLVKRFGRDFRKHLSRIKEKVAGYGKSSKLLPIDRILREEVIPDEKPFVRRINSLLERMNELTRQEWFNRTNVSRYYMWGDKIKWPIPGIKRLEELVKHESSSVSPEHLDIISQIITEIKRNRFLFERYRGYFNRVLDSGYDLDGSLDSPHIPQSSVGEQEAAVARGAAYSYVQAYRLKDSFLLLKKDFVSFKRRMDSADKDGFGFSGEMKKYFSALYENMKRTEEEYLNGEGAVDKLFAEMQRSLHEYGLREQELFRSADSKPDGLDPRYIGSFRGIDPERDALK